MTLPDCGYLAAYRCGTSLVLPKDESEGRRGGALIQIPKLGNRPRRRARPSIYWLLRREKSLNLATDRLQ